MKRIEELALLAARLQDRKRVAEETWMRVARELDQARDHLEDVATAQKVVQEVASTIQQQAHDRIASIVSRCLQAVFDRSYQFRIEFEEKRGKTEAILSFAKGELIVDPCNASGGGVLDVGAFGIRLASLLLSRPRRRKLLVLDEPFRFMSPNRVERVRSLIEALAMELGVQFVIVTHDQSLQVGRVVRIPIDESERRS